jgi:nucleotide-binding universal stress UspA family protein
MLYTHILVPTDFSPAANQALPYAFEEATQHQAKLTLLHVTRHYPSVDVYYIEGTQRGVKVMPPSSAASYRRCQRLPRKP